jgi:hypothetical protein
VTRHSGVMMLTEGEVTPGRGKGGDNVSWADANLTEPKNKENSRCQFSCYNWTVKI